MRKIRDGERFSTRENDAVQLTHDASWNYRSPQILALKFTSPDFDYRKSSQYFVILNTSNNGTATTVLFTKTIRTSKYCETKTSKISDKIFQH